MKNTLAENMRRFNTKNLNESHSIYSDALDTVIELGAILKLKDGTFVRVGAIPAKENPKYKTGMILVADLSRDARGPLTIDINNDVEEIYEKEHPIK